jgi:hypothetical protein
MAAGLAGRFTLVAGAFSRDRSLSAERGSSWGVDPNRVHTDHNELFAAEAARPDGIEAVAIATPNDSHFALVSDALAAGLHVICDKPVTATLEQAVAGNRLETRRSRSLTASSKAAIYSQAAWAFAIVRRWDNPDRRLLECDRVKLPFVQHLHVCPLRALSPVIQYPP